MTCPVYRALCRDRSRLLHVEKLRISDVVIFRKKPVKPQSQSRSAMKRSALPHERQKTNLAESPCFEKLVAPYGQKFIDFAKREFFNTISPDLPNAASCPNSCDAPKAALVPERAHSCRWPLIRHVGAASRRRRSSRAQKSRGSRTQDQRGQFDAQLAAVRSLDFTCNQPTGHIADTQPSIFLGHANCLIDNRGFHVNAMSTFDKTH